jgi:hypothetical protein
LAKNFLSQPYSTALVAGGLVAGALYYARTTGYLDTTPAGVFTDAQAFKQQVIILKPPAAFADGRCGSIGST